jgi:dolichol kinase
MNSLKFEIHRKSFHMMGLLCPIIYYFISKQIAILILLPITALVLYIDVYRHKLSKIQYVVEFFLGKIMRDSEIKQKKLASCSWMFLGLFISCILFNKEIASVSWLVLFLSDSAAAIIGKKIGKNKFSNGKSFEGSAGFFISALFIGLFYRQFADVGYNFLSLVIASIIATYVEIYSKDYGVDDNFSIPIVFGMILSVI